MNLTFLVSKDFILLEAFNSWPRLVVICQTEQRRHLILSSCSTALKRDLSPALSGFQDGKYLAQILEHSDRTCFVY